MTKYNMLWRDCYETGAGFDPHSEFQGVTLAEIFAEWRVWVEEEADFDAIVRPVDDPTKRVAYFEARVAFTRKEKSDG